MTTSIGLTNIEAIRRDLKLGRNIFLTGPAGTGKSHLIKEYAKASVSPVAITATTGVAALNLSGITLHSFFGIGIQTSAEYVETMKKTLRWHFVKGQIVQAHSIVIDECSMLRSDVFELVDAVLKEATGNKDIFGGKRLIIAGDFLQLPPVVKTYEGLKAPWAFQSSQWAEANFSIHGLTHIYRQEDAEFIKALHEMRRGQCHLGSMK